MNESYPETILFVGAGATASLSMPQTSKMSEFLWDICDVEDLTTHSVFGKIRFLDEKFNNDVALMAYVLDSGYDGSKDIDFNDPFLKKAFPDVSSQAIIKTVSNLRKHYDWSALRLILKSKKGDSKGKLGNRDFTQEVFTLMDVCLRDERGFEVFYNGETIFLTVGRIKAAYETLILFINTMFAYAWNQLITSEPLKLKRYSDFFFSLAKLMQDEAREKENKGLKFNKPDFYRFSYSVVTTNFDPLFLWMIWKAHDKVNHKSDIRIGCLGRSLKLLMNFPNSLGMRKPADVGDNSLSPDIWFPCTEAVAQNVNNLKYNDNRIFRLGMYYPVHGMSNTRKCPKCGRLNLYMGDSWEEKSKTLFPNGIIYQFKWGQKPRTYKEHKAHDSGEYDALECHFCGQITHSYDNFMFMQTQLKRLPPSFIKEATDEALAAISHAKHIVLLGYSLPIDDAIWGSLLSMMTCRKTGDRVFCSVVATRDVNGPDKWLMGSELDNYIKQKESQDKEKVRAIKNAITVFGKENVRAYVRGIPDVFHNGAIDDVKALMYPQKGSY